jgi:DNA uptake protein ComE-like DNA-binding protein
MASAGVCLAAVAAPAALPAAPAASANAAHAGTALPPGHAALVTKKKTPPPKPTHLVDINSAGRSELKTLPGIGDAEADSIIAHRPYLTKTELVTKQVLPTGPFLALKSRVVAMQKFKQKTKG